MNDTLDQGRAKHILDALDGNISSIFSGDAPRQRKREEQQPANKKWLGEFTGAAKSLPAAILINGFGMAIATMIAQRADKGDIAVVQLLGDWLVNHGDRCGSPYTLAAGPAPVARDDLPEHLLRAIIRPNDTAYVTAEAEALEYLAWLKVLAKPLAPEDKPANRAPRNQPVAAEGK